MDADRQAVLLAEHQSAQDCYLHYDAFRWQSGTFLIAGVFAFWGFIISNEASWLDAKVIGIASTLVSILMAVWLLYAHHYRQIYLYKLHRIHDLEKLLDMKQHLMFRRGSPEVRYARVFGPRGHYLDFFVFFLTSAGGPILGYLRLGFSCYLLLPALVFALVISLVLCNEMRVQLHLCKLNLAADPRLTPPD